MSHEAMASCYGGKLVSVVPDHQFPHLRRGFRNPEDDVLVRREILPQRGRQLAAKHLGEQVVSHIAPAG
jgi:hypothetical protein